MMRSAHDIMLQIQREQQAHDLLAHRDILNLDTPTRLKHMALHFLKYAGKIAVASESRDLIKLADVMVDSFIICMATANTLNVNVGRKLDISAEDLQGLVSKLFAKQPVNDLFHFSLVGIVTIAGKMAKSIESTDHMERGNPRAELEELILQLAEMIMITLGGLEISVATAVNQRWHTVESKSIFSVH